MKLTVDISMYPLHEDYENKIVEFIKELRQVANIDVETNGMSTQIFGEFDEVMTNLNNSIKKVLESDRCVFTIKITEGERRKENIPESIK